jgi:hypothetical protein
MKKKRKRYVYLVHRMSSDKCSYPTLGVHSNVKKANEHFESVRDDRLRPNYGKMLWCRFVQPNDYGCSREIREAYFTYKKGTETENLKLTRFQVN